MKKFVLFFLLVVWPAVSMGRINFAALVLDEKSDLFGHRNDAKLRRALLVTNGKNWYIENVMENVDAVEEVKKLIFIQGDYFVISGIKSGSKKLDEYAEGLKKAIDYLSANNDTLYQFSRGDYHDMADPVLKKTLSKGVSVYFTRAYMADWRYNFDRFDFNRYSKPMVDIFWDSSILNIVSVDDYVFKTVFPPDVTRDSIWDLWSNIRKSNADSLDEKTEKLYQLINKFDDYVLSLPFPQLLYQLELLDWGYTPGRHRNPGAVADFLKEKALIKK